MKATGIVRHIDPLGRIVIPKELRKALALDDNAPMEIYTTDEGILVKPYTPDVWEKTHHFVAQLQRMPQSKEGDILLKKLAEAIKLIRND